MVGVEDTPITVPLKASSYIRSVAVSHVFIRRTRCSGTPKTGTDFSAVVDSLVDDEA
jgi:hypothetical protein